MPVKPPIVPTMLRCYFTEIRVPPYTTLVSNSPLVGRLGSGVRVSAGGRIVCIN